MVIRQNSFGGGGVGFFSLLPDQPCSNIYTHELKSLSWVPIPLPGTSDVFERSVHALSAPDSPSFPPSFNFHLFQFSEGHCYRNVFNGVFKKVSEAIKPSITITLSKFIPPMPSTGHYPTLLYPSPVLFAEKWSFPTVILFPLPVPLIPRTHLSRFSCFGLQNREIEWV